MLASLAASAAALFATPQLSFAEVEASDMTFAAQVDSQPDVLSAKEWQSIFVPAQKQPNEPLIFWSLNDLAPYQLKNQSQPLASFQIYYDLLCGESRDAHKALLRALDTSVPERYTSTKVNGFYGNMVKVQIVPFALPYHALAFDLMALIPLLQDRAKLIPYSNAALVTQVVEEYQDLCWSNISKINEWS